MNMENIINNLKAVIKSTSDENTAKELQTIIDSWNLTESALAGIILDTASKTITIDGELHTLTNQEFKTMELLATSTRPMNRNEILENAWDFAFVGARTVDVHIRKLRKKLGNDLIVTRKGVGYAIEQSITVK